MMRTLERSVHERPVLHPGGATSSRPAAALAHFFALSMMAVPNPQCRCMLILGSGPTPTAAAPRLRQAQSTNPACPRRQYRVPLPPPCLPVPCQPPRGLAGPAGTAPMLAHAFHAFLHRSLTTARRFSGLRNCGRGPRAPGPSTRISQVGGSLWSGSGPGPVSCGAGNFGHGPRVRGRRAGGGTRARVGGGGGGRPRRAYPSRPGSPPQAEVALARGVEVGPVSESDVRLQVGPIRVAASGAAPSFASGPSRAGVRCPASGGRTGWAPTLAR